MDFIREHVVAGATGLEIDALLWDYIRAHGHESGTKNYNGFPSSCCFDLNDGITNGIPGKAALRDGDVVGLLVPVVVDGWHAHVAESILIGDASDAARSVVQCALDSLHAAIEVLRPGCRVSDVGEAIVPLACDAGFSVVREYVGHGIGKRPHQNPSVPSYPVRRSHTERLDKGLTFAIQPLINAGSRHTVLDDDGWTVRTRDGALSAEFKHTILMTKDGPEILTATAHGPQPGNRA